jgi:hypothetical protein
MPRYALDTFGAKEFVIFPLSLSLSLKLSPSYDCYVESLYFSAY